MLVLTRCVGEEIVIAGNIRVTVVAVNGERVRIGVTAPPSVRIDRLEIHERRLELDEPMDKAANRLESIASLNAS
jgi:carbon storage regulator